MLNFAFQFSVKPLVAALPRLDGRREAAGALPGDARSPIDPDPRTCRFYGRCPMGVPLCAEAMPPLRPFAELRQSACHFAESLAAQE